MQRRRAYLAIGLQRWWEPDYVRNKKRNIIEMPTSVPYVARCFGLETGGTLTIIAGVIVIQVS